MKNKRNTKDDPSVDPTVHRFTDQLFLSIHRQLVWSLSYGTNITSIYRQISSGTHSSLVLLEEKITGFLFVFIVAV